MSEKRGPWYLLTGVILGVALGMLVGWSIAPVEYVDTTPSTLRSDFKDQYRYMIAAAYSATGNLERARARLELLADVDSVKALGDQAQRMLAANTAQEVVRSVADLSQALQGSPAATTAFPSPQPVTPSNDPTLISTISPASSTEPSTVPPAQGTDTPDAGISATPEGPSTTPISTATLRPAPTPTRTPGAPFGLTNQAPFCEATQPGLLQVSLQDANGEPAAGVELVVTWLGGEEHFFTGLKPELGNGYADFVMSPNVEYALSLSGGSVRVTGLSSSVCTAEDGSAYPGGILLEFEQP
jgi:hypothetical protein